MNNIKAVYGREILDSRGNPTVEVEVHLESGHYGLARVPSGASTGSHEALELRDGDAKRYRGKGTLKAVSNVAKIGEALVGKSVADQKEIDDLILELDTSVRKETLGANATLGVSLAVAHSAAIEKGENLFRHLNSQYAKIAQPEKITKKSLPTPLMNVINGGAHSDNPLDIQEFMIVPKGAPSFAEALRYGAETYHALGDLLKQNQLSTDVGDEGGFAPDISSSEKALELMVEAISLAGFKPGKDIALALDVAAGELFSDGKYHLEGKTLNADEMVAFFSNLADSFPLISIEDGMGEDDWEGWQNLTAELGKKIQLVGDDLFVTNLERLQKGIDEQSANAILIKPNQIGTLTETFQAIALAKASGFATVMSHRSGETQDTTISDMAVASNCGQIKAGAPARTDRVAKYNRLLQIEENIKKGETK